MTMPTVCATHDFYWFKPSNGVSHIFWYHFLFIPGLETVVRPSCFLAFVSYGATHETHGLTSRPLFRHHHLAGLFYGFKYTKLKMNWSKIECLISKWVKVFSRFRSRQNTRQKNKDPLILVSITVTIWLTAGASLNPAHIYNLAYLIYATLMMKI
jgi:hypothetical protein